MMSNEQETAVRLVLTALPAVNYAMQHNGIPIIQSVAIENTTDGPLENVELEITAAPAFALPLTRHIDLLPAKQTVTLTRPELILDGQFLAGTTEKITGLLHLRLKRGEEELAACHQEMTVFAFDEWHGLGLYPELLAAFITPNHPALAKIIARATEFMGQWTGDTSMDAYQSQDPNRVLRQGAAIFSALKEEAIAYAVAPASFEQSGQRVRLVDMVLQQKLGNCLELTLLYAACLEAVGLHPLLISTPGHIFTGLWLEQRMFPESIQDDVSLLTKRLASGVNEIAVVETTCVTSGSDASFDDARCAAEKKLTDPVECIIDVRRARLSRIAPLPMRVHTDTGWVIRHDTPVKKQSLAAPEQLDETIRFDPNAPEEVIPKKQQWERKLLDLGLRNTLINLRLTKTQLPILTGSLDELENTLADGGDFSILPRPADWKNSEFSFENLPELGKNTIISAEFENRRLRSVLTEGELAAAVKGLYRAAKTALEENGANTLYLALGLLRWYESGRSTRPRYAPIILLPIEIVRRSALQGYVIRLRDEEPQMNVTLLEKLKQDFGIQISGIDPLPMDEHGVDIRLVLTILRKAVMEQPRWDVLEAASIGIFSFSQFVMWNDIRNRTDDLMRNKVVRSLMDGKLSWQAEPLEIGDRVTEDGVLLPMSADASQLYAIQTAAAGKSFVLHGPPGTGKSQTITSLIANALAQGKRVLFVAEKLAALEVVQKRLDKIGIGPFCLELHSNKSRKKDVLEQLRQATEVSKTASAGDFAAKANQISAQRQELDAYVRQLHSQLPCGRSLFDLIDDYQSWADAPELKPFDTDFLKSLTAEKLHRQQLAVENMVAAGRAVGHPGGHPLSAVGCTAYAQSLRSSLGATGDAYLAQIEAISGHVATLAEVSGKKTDSFEALKALADFAGALALWCGLPPAWSGTDCPQLYFEEIRRMAAHFETANALEKRLLERFTPDVLTLDGEQLFREFVETSAKWFLPKSMGLSKLVKKLNVFAKTPISKDELQNHLTVLRDYRGEVAAANAIFETKGKELAHLYGGKNTDWVAITDLAARAEESAQTLYDTFGSYRLPDNANLKTAAEGLRDGFGGFADAKEKFDNLLDIQQFIEEKWLENQKTICYNVLEHQDSLRQWTAYMATVSEVRALGLGPVADSYAAGMAHDDVYPACRKALLKGLICLSIDESENLNQFSGAVFNKKIDQFKRMDQQWMDLSRQEVYCRLAAKVPDFTREAAHSSELGILQRCIKSGGRGVSIRSLFDQIPNLLPRLCPCMLMSPISAAQYLDPKGLPFDIVVFDEASQLPTCKAVGVLARGEDAVIVGDPKQMPPTSFFATNTVDEDNLDVEDLESILDDCLALNMPQSHLLWHYRSRHESLIAFSNSRFYENRLYTFPSVNDRASKVRLVPVEGRFERGKNRINRAEAQAVVEELRRRCRENAGESVGVVTFNISQQHLIDDLLNEACAQDPELEKWAFGAEEPVFIKNLENVQGDERDVILFSVGYGPDESGKVYMNFGPLNRDGGWRRLNVAVTRARREMVVFSTLKPEQIDLNRTKAEGVAALRGFLEYAAGRPLALDESAIGRQTASHSGIASAIARGLEQAGYETDLSVGRSAYRIDIGVVDPKAPDHYLLGILLDGDSYGAAQTTRDREVAQIGVLNGLGWNILRVWAMDWWEDSEKELKRILKELKALQKPAAPKPEPPAPQPEPVRLESRAAAPAQPVVPLYRAAELPLKPITADEFVEPRHSRTIQSRIKQVIEAEAPISAALLTKRVVQSFGISRAGSRIQSHMDGILRKMALPITAQSGTLFYWRADQDPETYPDFRVGERDVRDVPVQEVANGVCAVLREQISMSQEDLLRETAKKLGYTRLGGNVLTALEQGVRYAETHHRITLGTNGCYILAE